MQQVAIFISVSGRHVEIPKKYLRKINCKYLFLYAVELAQKIAECGQDVFLLTDDEEVELQAKRENVNVLLYKPSDLPAQFSHPAILDLLKQREKSRGKPFDSVVWLSPDYPLVTIEDLRLALNDLSIAREDAIFTVSENQESQWVYTHTYQPNFKPVKNANAQVLHKELGAFFVMKREAILLAEGYMGKQAKPFFIPTNRAVVVETMANFWAVAQYLKRKKILFVIIGYAEVGMGHVYRALQLAQFLFPHDIEFLCDKDSQQAFAKIQACRYPVTLQPKNKTLLDCINCIRPYMVINDILDTSRGYIEILKAQGIKTVSFEDQGEGAVYADLVVNALFEKATSANMLVGSDYFDIREEFITAPPFVVREHITTILLTFGGADYANLTQRILAALLIFAQQKKIKIVAITGPAYSHAIELEYYLNHLSESQKKYVEWQMGGTQKISEFMLKADLVISSAGRTVYELAYLAIPTIVIAANRRETTHLFAQHQGMRYLGRHDEFDNGELINAVESLVSWTERKKMHKALGTSTVGNRYAEVIEKIEQML